VSSELKFHAGWQFRWLQPLIHLIELAKSVASPYRFIICSGLSVDKSLGGTLWIRSIFLAHIAQRHYAFAISCMSADNLNVPNVPCPCGLSRSTPVWAWNAARNKHHPWRSNRDRRSANHPISIYLLNNRQNPIDRNRPIRQSSRQPHAYVRLLRLRIVLDRAGSEKRFSWAEVRPL